MSGESCLLRCDRVALWSLAAMSDSENVVDLVAVIWTHCAIWMPDIA